MDSLRQLLWDRARDSEQFEVAEHALERVVQLVCDTRDKLAQRGELFRLGQPSPQFLALGFGSRLRREVAGDQHGADPPVFWIEEGRNRAEERPLERRVRDFAAPRRLALGSWRALSC